LLNIGSYGNRAYPNSFGGYIDDLRITKGVARYTSNFTPPTAQLPGGETGTFASGLWTGLEQCDAIRREIWPGFVPSIVTDGLVVHLDAGNSASYPGSGATWFDLITNSNNGTISGATYDSANGGSLSFDGMNDGVSVPGTNLSLNQMTISSWNYSTNYNQNGFMFEKTTNGTVNTQYSLFYNATGNNAIYYRTFGLSSQDLFVDTTTAGVVNNQWNNIVATFDGSQKKIYVNGVLRATQNVTGTVTQNSTGLAYIGIYGNFGGYPFNGNIASTQIYNKALTASEITQNFDALKGRYGL